MKNKKKTYILLFIVLLIWGLVIYQFFSLGNSEVAINETGSNYDLKPLNIKKRDTFSINVDYRDPFLGRMYQPETKSSKPFKRKVHPKEPVIWPNIIYKGIVSDGKDKKKVFMVMINGQAHFMKENDREQGIQLKSGNRSSIQVIYEGQRNDIMIQG